MQPAVQPTLYESIEALSGGLTGEILNGQLHTQPRLSFPHGFAGSALGAKLFSAFYEGNRGPGRWWIIDEPEIHFVYDVEVTAPDLAGWRRGHMPMPPIGHGIEVVPDGGREILSPYTAD